MTRPRQSVTHVPVERLTAHPANVREGLGDLSELAASIRQHGILQPLTATELEGHPDQLLLLAGHRRLAASLKVGVSSVPVIIRHGVTDPTEHLVLMLVENTHRRDLSPVERAQAYGALRHQGLTLTDIARRTGSHVSTISYYLNLLDLDEVSLNEVRTGQLNSTTAIAAVRDARQAQRAKAGEASRGRPKTHYFGTTHRLAATVKALCTHRDEHQVGSIGCGPCWEKAICDEHAAQRVAS